MEQTIDLAQQSLVYRLRVGAIGHRDLIDSAELATSVARWLKHLASVLDKEHGVAIEWSVASALAKGADRIIARAAMNALGAKLNVIVPFDLQEYRKDFCSASDIVEFDDLMTCRSDLTVAWKPTTATSGNLAPESITGEIRTRGYLRVGQAIVDASEIVIAIWDGKPAMGQGGTGDIVPYALRRGRLVIRFDPAHPSAEPTVVRSRGNAASDVYFSELPDTSAGLSPGYFDMNDFLRDRIVCSASVNEHVTAMSRHLYATAVEEQLASSALKPVFATMLPHFCRADLIANRYQRKYALANAGLLLLSAIAVTAASIHAHFPRVISFHSCKIPIGATIEVLAMAIAIAWLAVGRKRRWHRKWLRARYLAERIRLGLYSVFLPSGYVAVSESESVATRFYSGPDQWLFDLSREITKQARSRAASNDPGVLQGYLSKAWIEDQLMWHRRNALRRTELYHRFHAMGYVLLGFTLFFACAHLGREMFSESDSPDSPDMLLSLLAISLPAWAATAHALNNQLESARMAARSQGMADALLDIKDKFQSAPTVADRWDILSNAQRLFDNESTEWWVLLSFREIPLPG